MAGLVEGSTRDERKLGNEMNEQLEMDVKKIHERYNACGSREI